MGIFLGVIVFAVIVMNRHDRASGVWFAALAIVLLNVGLFLVEVRKRD